MNNLQIFKNEEFGEGRVIEQNGEPWFVGKDVADILGYTNSRDALGSHVDDEDKNTVAISDGKRGNPNQTVINESGLYSLILSSKLPQAKQFKRWVTSEVLPSIRKHGTYMTPEKIEEVLLNPDTIISLAQELKDERALRNRLQDKIEKDRPKTIFADAVAASKTSILVGDLAKLIKQNGVDTGQKRLFQWLRENGYLIKRKGADWNMPTQRAMDKGLFEVKETVITHADGHTSVSKTVKVTGKGQQYFINKFLEVA